MKIRGFKLHLKQITFETCGLKAGIKRVSRRPPSSDQATQQ